LLARVTAPVVEVAGVNPVNDVWKDVTPPADPFDAEVICPCALTVMFAFVYDPAVTAVLVMLN
jgi:hypothetical protein